MRGIRLTQTVCQPVCIAPLYICPQVCVEDCHIACQAPCVRCGDGDSLTVEQTFTVRVPVTVGADARLGCARFICVKGGFHHDGTNAALPANRGL